MSYSPNLPPGQATMANSSPVVLASDQSAIAVTASATNLDIRDLLFASDKVDVSGSTSVGVTGTFWQATQPVSIAQDIMLGTDFSDVLGTASLILGTQADDIANTVDGLQTSSFGYMFDGSTWDRVRGTSADGLLVNLGANNDVTVTGTVTVSATDLDIRNLVAATDTISVHGDVGIVDQLDLTNSNPLVVAIVDGSGDQITSFGGGTQYTEDAAAAANPVGTAVNLIRSDTPATITTTDGDNVAQRGTNYGAAYVQLVTSAGAYIDSVGGGTQYSDGDANADPTGTVAMGTDGSNIFALHTDTAGDLQVDVLTMPTVTVQATNLDIRDLTSASDSVAAVQSGTWNITNISGTISLPTGAATEATLSSLLTSSQLIDDTIIVLGTDTYTEATSKGQILAAVRRDADTTLVNTTNEYGPLQMDANGRLKVEVFSGETLPVSLTSTTITGTVAVTQSGTWDEVGINDSGNSITVDAPVGTPVNVQIGNATLTAGVIDETGASAVDALAVGGGTAHDAVNSGNPLLNGYEAIAHGSNPTAVAAADRTKGYANRAGIPFVMGGHPNIQSAEYFTSGAITDDNILPAISTGTKYVITSITVTCSAANATTPSVRIGFGTTTLTAQGSTNADAVTKIILSHPGIPAGGGVQKGNGSGIVGIGGDGEELRITCTTPTTSMIVQVDYFTIES